MEGLGNGTKLDNATLSKKLAMPLAYAVAGYNLMSQGVDMLLMTNASLTSSYAASINVRNPVFGVSSFSPYLNFQCLSNVCCCCCTPWCDFPSTKAPTDDQQLPENRC